MKNKFFAAIVCALVFFNAGFMYAQTNGTGTDIAAFDASYDPFAKVFKLDAFVGTSPKINLNNTSPSRTYQWQEHVQDDVWKDIAGSTGTSLTISKVKLSDDGRVFRCKIDGGASYSDTVMLMVANKPKALKPDTMQPVYDGGSASLSVPAVEGLYYQWESYNKSAKRWEALEGATNNVLDLAGLDASQNGRQFRCVVSPFESMYGGVACATMTIKILQSAGITQHPAATTVLSGKNAVFTVRATGANLMYHWQVSEDGVNGWDFIHNATKSTLTVVKVGEEEDGLFYRCTVWSRGNEAEARESSAAKLTVYALTKIVSTTGNQTVFAGEKAVFGVFAQGDDLEYEWQYKLPKTKEWVTVGGNSVSRIQISSVDYPDGTSFRCLGESVRGIDPKIVASKEMKLTVWQKGEVQILAPAAEAFEGKKAVMKAKAVGSGSFKYQWQESADGVVFTDIPRATAATYTTPVLTAADFSKYYQCVATNAAGETLSDSFKVIQLFKADNSQFTNHPQNVSAAALESAVFSVEVNPIAGSKVKYLWEVLKPGASSWVAAGSATNTLTVKKLTTALDGAKYRCKISNEANAKGEYAISDEAVLSVSGKPTVIQQPKAVAGYGGGSFSVVSGTNATYQWQVSYDGGKTWETQYGETEPKFDFEYFGEYAANGTAKVLVRCLVSNNGYTVTTSAVANTVYEKPNVSRDDLIVANPEEQEYDGFAHHLYLDFPATLKLKARGYALKYQWYVIDSDANKKAIKGATSANLTVSKTIAAYRNEFDSLYLVCDVYNASGELISVDLSFVLHDISPMPVNLSGCILEGLEPWQGTGPGFSVYTTGAATCDIYLDSAGNFAKTASYSFKRKSPNAAQLTISYMDYNGKKLSYTGELSMQWDVTGKIVLILEGVDSSKTPFAFPFNYLEGFSAPKSFLSKNITLDVEVDGSYLEIEFSTTEKGLLAPGTLGVYLDEQQIEAETFNFKYSPSGKLINLTGSFVSGGITYKITKTSLAGVVDYYGEVQNAKGRVELQVGSHKYSGLANLWMKDKLYAPLINFGSSRMTVNGQLINIDLRDLYYGDMTINSSLTMRGGESGFLETTKFVPQGFLNEPNTEIKLEKGSYAGVRFAPDNKSAEVLNSSGDVVFDLHCGVGVMFDPFAGSETHWIFATVPEE